MFLVVMNRGAAHIADSERPCPNRSGVCTYTSIVRQNRFSERPSGLPPGGSGP